MPKLRNIGTSFIAAIALFRARSSGLQQAKTNMTPRLVFQAFLLSFAAMTTVASSQNRSETVGGGDASVVPSSALFPADGRASRAETPESTELFPADRGSSAKQWKPTQTENWIAVPLPSGPGGSVLQVSGQPAAPGVPEENSKVPPAPAANNSDPMSPMTPMGGLHGPSGYSAPMPVPMYGGPVAGGMPMTPVDQVFGQDAPTCGGCCASECCSDWCKRCWWFGTHSTCDMPQHFPYPPAFHGYYYFRAYNYSQIFQHRLIAPLLGAEPFAPYETTNFQKIYVDALGEEEANRQAGDGVLKPLMPDSGKLPNLEELLAGKHDLDSPRGRPGKVEPPKPGIDGNSPPLPKIGTGGKKSVPFSKGKAAPKKAAASPKAKDEFDE
jgi:hypothetical protein